jgi:hypothetical protein
MSLPHSHAECIRACQLCFETCLSTAEGHCLEQGGEHVAPAHLRLMHDCAGICQVAASFMLRDSTFHPRTCALCAEVCAACADDCERFDDERMQLCAEVCRQCAQACREMTAAHRAARA